MIHSSQGTCAHTFSSTRLVAGRTHQRILTVASLFPVLTVLSPWTCDVHAYANTYICIYVCEGAQDRAVVPVCRRAGERIYTEKSGTVEMVSCRGLWLYHKRAMGAQMSTNAVSGSFLDSASTEEEVQVVVVQVCRSLSHTSICSFLPAAVAPLFFVCCHFVCVYHLPPPPPILWFLWAHFLPSFEYVRCLLSLAA